MTPLLEIAMRSTVPLLLGLLACRLLRPRSAASRHAVLALSLLGAVVVVPLTTVVPSWTLQLPETEALGPDRAALPAPANEDAVAATPGAGSTVPPGEAGTIAFPVLLIWVAGIAIGLLRTAAGLVRLRRLTARARPMADDRWSALVNELVHRYSVTRRVDVLVTGASDILATWGVFRPQVLLPPDSLTWTAERVRIVLAHELAHIRRNDWLVQVGADAFRLLFWFNPAAWMVARRLRRESERACDDEVLRTGVSPATYASHLLDLARHGRAVGPAWATTLSMARSSILEWRIAAMLNAHLNRTVPSRLQLAAACAAIAIVVLPASALRLSAAQTGPAPLTGAVYDVTGAVLPDVAITVEDEQQARQGTRTDASGHFEFAVVNPGRYTLRAEVPGFRALTTTFDLKTAADWQRTITLQVGTLEETVRVSGRRSTSPRSAAAVPEPVRIGGNIKAPRKLRDVKPVYPQAMQDAGLEGIVPLEALIARDGSVSSVRVVSAQVHPELAAAAAAAVRQWQFSPTLLNGAAVEVQMTVLVEFSLAAEP